MREYAAPFSLALEARPCSAAGLLPGESCPSKSSFSACSLVVVPRGEYMRIIGESESETKM